MSNPITIALAGNPNIGKTTLLNALTGAKYSVGNWAGVTVEKKEAHFSYKSKDITLVDLPGTYSLSTYSLDESIARNYIVTENPDVILNIVDGSNLERNLNLTLQLLELEKPLVIALNMMDIAEKKGIHIDLPKLSSLLGVPVIPIIAAKRTGFDALLDAVIAAPSQVVPTISLPYCASLQALIAEVSSQFEKINFPHVAPLNWLASRALEKDPEILHHLPTDFVLPTSTLEVSSSLTDARYEYISNVVEQVIRTTSTEDQISTTDRIDRVLTHKYFGIPIFALIMLSIFYFTFNLVGDPLKGVLEYFFEGIIGFVSSGLTSLSVADWLQSLIVDGILNGVFGILTFLPNIACLFICLTILEDTGYMARVAFMLDHFMKRLGLNGKAIIPMLLGFGCSVPAIMGTRTLDDETDRLTSIFINPFMSCSARLPIYTLFAAAFFPGKEAIVIFSLYLLGIMVALIAAYIFKHTVFKSDGTPFIMELPPYHLPSLCNTFNQVWEKVKGFLIKAGTVIFIASALLWFILNFNFTGLCDLSDSIGATIGRFIAPVFAPLGFGTWQAALSLLAGIVGKEIVVSNMLIIYGLGEMASASAFGLAVADTFTPLSAYSFLVFCLLYTPCVAAIGAIRRETNSRKWTCFALCYQTLVAWGVAFIIYQVGLFLFR